MHGICKLCQKEKNLQKSHLTPSFVTRWLKESSPGFIRSSQNPNVRTQDGIKDYLLCKDCEQLFSKWERVFANDIFYPYHSNLGKHEYYDYGDWCLKFSVSVSWRLLTKALTRDLSNLNDNQLKAAKEAEFVWREFLLSNRKDPGSFCQHLVPLDIVKSINSSNPSPYLNRYLLRSIDFDIPSNNKRAFVYVKLGRLAQFGIIDERYPSHWTGTKLHLRKGIIGRKILKLPAGIDEYFHYRSNKSASLLANMSDSQKEKVEKMIIDNLDDLVQFEIFNAISQDAFLFGNDAFSITEVKKDEG